MNRNRDILFTIINGISVLVCLLAAILVFGLKLYKKLVYRLGVYQVLSSLAFATVETLQIMFINYDEHPQVYGRVCTAIGWFSVYTRWMKLLFTMWVAFHLFCFAVLHKNLQKLEVLYVVTSLFVPAVIAAVPLTTHSYRLSPLHSYCYIENSSGSQVELIENLALWDLPAMVILVVLSIGMVVMVIKLAHRACWRSKYEPITEGDLFQKALNQLLPLAAFPILFFVCIIPELTNHIFEDDSATPGKSILTVELIFISMWSMASGVTLLIHLCVYAKRQRSRSGVLVHSCQ